MWNWWQNSNWQERFFALVQFVLVLLVIFAVLYNVCAKLYSYSPPPGWSVAILAGIAAFMSLHPNMTAQQKAVWMILIGYFVFIELTAINRDRLDIQIHTDAEKQQQADQFKTVIDKIMGTDSVPCVIPETIFFSDGSVPLVIWNKGKNDLTGVEIRILSDKEFVDGVSIFLKPTIVIGTIHPTWAKSLSERLSPSLQTDTNGIITYTLEIWAQNGFYSEVINFRRSQSRQWAFQYWLIKQERLDKPEGNIPVGAMRGKLITNCSLVKWSDEPQN